MNPFILFAQGLDAGALVRWIVVILVLAGVIGIAYVVAQQAGIAIPPFLVRIFWIVVAVVVGVVAITFLARYL
jgi:hypothetical protein